MKTKFLLVFQTSLFMHIQKKCNGVTPLFSAIENILRDLHIEQSILGLHGDLIKGSGLDSALADTNLWTISTPTIVDANNIKRSRYCLQVAICVNYELLKEAHADSQSNLSLFDWLEERSKIRQMAYYWRLTLNFQIQVLIFVR